MNRSRFASRAGLSCVLAAGLLLAVPTIASAGDGVKSLKLMPGDTNIAMNLNVKRLRSSKAYDEVVAQMRQNGDFKETEASLKKAGVDLKKDVDTVTLGMRSDSKGSSGGFVVVVEGRFKEAKVFKAMKAENADAKKKKHRGVTYYVFGDDGALAFLGKNMVMAEKNRIADVIDRFKNKGKKSAANNRIVKAMLSKTDTKKDVWFVAQILNGGGGLGPMGDTIKTLVGSLDMKKGLKVRMRAGFKDTKTPAEAVTQFEAIRPMAAGHPTVKSMGLDAVVERAELSADEKDLVFKVDLSVAEAESLKGALEQMGGAL